MDLTRVIGVISGKGGIGKTTFSINLGIALSNFGKKALVIDCNVTTPHLAYYLGAGNYSITINDIFREELDAKFAPLSREGVMFIPASEDLKDIINLDIGNLRKHVTKLTKKDMYDFIILDSAPGLGREALSVLRACDEIIFVTSPTIPTLTDVTRCAEVASMMGHRNFKIVLNMVRNKNYELKALKARSFFRTPILGSIPFDENVMDSTSLGVPIMWYRPKCKVSENYMEVAANLIGVNYEKPSLFKRISRKLKRLIRKT